jgi:hypothetical protein
VVEGLGDHVGLGLEVVGRRAERDAGLGGHGAVIDGGDAAAADHADRRLEQRAAAGGAARLSGGRRR